MKIRLLAPDSKIPNYAIMKISTYHKRLGDDAAWYSHLFDYADTDILYISKVFTFSLEPQYLPLNAKIIRGGTGYDLSSKLPEEIENITELDYSLYPECDYSIIFTTRGCIRKCPFCVVPIKEGKIYTITPSALNPKGKWIRLLDNNFFASNDWKERLEYLKSLNQPIDFNTGIDLRILTEEQAKALGTLKIKTIHCAWDNYKDKDIILPKLELLTKYVKPYKIMVYVLVGFESKEIVATDLERVLTLKNMGVKPFAMGYVDFNDPNYQKHRTVKDFCRWVNMKSTFESCSWEKYKRS
jgi:hypothetical protein